MKTRFWTWAAAAIFLPGILAAQVPVVADEGASAPQALVSAFGWASATQGLFVTSVITDAQNNIWAGTEGNGLWCYDSRGKKWTQYTVKDGLGDDNVYALAVDKLGRVWAGHLNHGVSVWNGEKWKNYGLVDGPLGDRVFAIATCPTDGDVWIATDCGVTRYSIAKDDWDYFTRASGLPSNQVQAIAFDSKGNIFLGTQCDGIATAVAADNYKKWKTTAGPLQMPTAASGDGLPGSLVSDIAVLNGDKTIIVATQNGLGISADGGEKWKYMRGQDWQTNVAGLYGGTTPVGDEIEPPEKPQGQDKLLMEDWVTCIRQDDKTKNIWIGHRKVGAEARNADLSKFVSGAGGDSWHYFIKAFCFPAKGPSLVAVSDFNLGGLMMPEDSKAELEPGAEPPKTAPPLPSSAKAPDADTLAALSKLLGIYRTALRAGEGVFLGDDWRTQGDWVGRYGNSYAMVCGIDADGLYQGEPNYEVKVGIGPHNRGELAPEAHIENATSEDRRILYVPAIGHREDAEFNDLSCRGTFPPYWEGPDLWVDIKVPDGIHCVSLYFCNNDVHTGNGTSLVYANIFRDYDLQLLTWAEDRDAVQKSTPLARARVTDYVGGVYKQFVVAGPARYILRVGRNHSFGAKLQGVFIDRLSDDGPEKRKQMPGFDTVDYGPAALKDKSVLNGNPLLSAASGLWDTLDDSFDKRGIAGLQFPLRLIAYRAAVAANAPAGLLDSWRWQIGIWQKEDRDGFDKAMADAFKAYAAKHPELKADSVDK